ncbi:unnamed protein product [Cladocopium goreaui]|uniref:Glycogenin-1 n=1 Tax=Cladocopium goreaui TaxID=2562237 RepID=A0A9P1FRB5_9DINO|nr:unnamed protein product [Cladocopium goreaui]
MMWPWLLQLLIPGASGKVAVVSLATNDYYAKGAFVALHSAGLHSGVDVDRLLLVPASSKISSDWLRRFERLNIKVVDVPDVLPSSVLQAAMEAERQRLQQQGILEILQPMPYGGAFAKVHAWDPALGYEKILLLDGDLLVKRRLRPLLRLEPVSAGKDLNDAFNYGVVVLKPDAVIHAGLVKLLMHASEDDLRRYNTRKSSEVGLCDQTLVAGYVAEKTSLHFFEDRCEDPRERRQIDKARLVHFANHWLNFEALIENREAPGRVDSPRCYKAAFRYWHDIYHHGLQLSQLAETDPPVLPRYKAMEPQEDGMATPDDVKDMFLSFQDIKSNFSNSRGQDGSKDVEL